MFNTALFAALRSIVSAQLFAYVKISGFTLKKTVIEIIDTINKIDKLKRNSFLIFLFFRCTTYPSRNHFTRKLECGESIDEL